MTDIETLPALKARIQELETEVARHKAELATRPPSRGIYLKRAINIKGDDDARHMMLIRNLAADTDNQRSMAVRILAEHLQAIGKDFNDLAEATRPWLAEAQKAEKSKPKPVDWSKVEAAVKNYAAGKDKVLLNKMIKQIYAEIPALRQVDDGGRACFQYVHRCLLGLGFTMSPSGLTFSR